MYVHLLLLLLLLQHVSPMHFFSKKKNAIKPERGCWFQFTGAVIGGTNEYSKTYKVQTEYDDCGLEVKQMMTEEKDGTFKFKELLNCVRTVTELKVRVTSKGNLYGMPRLNIWKIGRLVPNKQYVFFMGEFEPTNHALFIRAAFIKELPNLSENTGYLLRLESSKGFSKIYGATELISDEQRMKWSDENEGVIVKLNKDGLACVHANESPAMVLGMYEINSAIACPICHCVFRNGTEPTRKLLNCEHFYHETCLNKSFNRTSENRKNRFKCPVCAESIAFIKQGNATDQRGKQETTSDEGISQRDAKVVTREMDAEGNVKEKRMKSIKEDALKQLIQQSHQQRSGQTTGDSDLIYFRDSSATLTSLFAIPIAQPVLQNGGGKPKFWYKLEFPYLPEEELHNQTLKIVDNLEMILTKRDVVDNDFGGLSDDDDDLNNGLMPNQEGDEDPDWFALQYIPDVDVPPSPPDSDEIAAGIRASIGSDRGERNGTDYQNTPNFGSDEWITEQRRQTAEKQAQLFEHCQQKSSTEGALSRKSTVEEKQINYDKPSPSMASPAKNWQNHLNGKSTGKEENYDDEDDTPLWELLAQSSCSSRTEEQSAERAVDEAQIWQILKEQRKEGKGGGWDSSPAKSTPGRRRPASIPRPKNNYERRKTTEKSTNNCVGNEAKKEMPIEEHQQEKQSGVLKALIDCVNDLRQTLLQPTKKFGFTIKILPDLEDKRREKFEVKVKSSEGEIVDIAVEVDGNQATVEYSNEKALLFFDIKVWKKKSDGGTEENNQSLASFTEERVQIKEEDDNKDIIYTFYMGAHFLLVIDEAFGPAPHSQNVLHYIAKVNCHGDRPSEFRSKGNSSGKFDVFLPGKRCTKFDIYIGKTHQNKPNELLAKASEKGVTIKKGETYRFKKTFNNRKNKQKGKEIVNEMERGQKSEKNYNENEMAKYVDDPEMEEAILESLKDQLRRKEEQKREEGIQQKGERQKTKKYDEYCPMGTSEENRRQEESEKAKLNATIAKLELNSEKKAKSAERTKLHQKRMATIGTESEDSEQKEIRKKERTTRKKNVQRKVQKIEEDSENDYETAVEDEKEDERKQKEESIKEKLAKILGNDESKEKLRTLIEERARNSPKDRTKVLEAIRKNINKVEMASAENSSIAPKTSKMTKPSSSSAFSYHRDGELAKSEANSAKKDTLPSIDTLVAMMGKRSTEIN